MRTAEEILKNYREKGYFDDKIRLIAKWRKEPVRTEIYNLLEAGGESVTATATAEVEQSLSLESEEEAESAVDEEDQETVAEVEAEASQEQEGEEQAEEEQARETAGQADTGDAQEEQAEEAEEKEEQATEEESEDNSAESVAETVSEDDEQQAETEPEDASEEESAPQTQDKENNVHVQQTTDADAQDAAEDDENETKGTQRIEVKIEGDETAEQDSGEDVSESADEQAAEAEEEQAVAESKPVLVKEKKYVEAELFDYSNVGNPTSQDQDEEEILTAVRLESRDEFDIRISGRDFVTDRQGSVKTVQSFDELEVIEEEAEPVEQGKTDFHFETYDKDVNDLEAPLTSQSTERKHITRKYLELKERSERLEKTRTRLEKLVEEMSERLNERYNENQQLKTKITDYEENRGDSRELQKMLCKKQRRLNKINEMLGQREQELHRIREKYNRKILTSAYESQRKIKIYRAFACASWMAAGVLLVFSIIFDVNPGERGVDSRPANTIAQMDNTDKLVKPVWDQFDDLDEENFLSVNDKQDSRNDSNVEQQNSEQTDTDESVARVQKKVERKRKVRYVVQKGDSLWKVSEKFYGSGHRYKEIAQQNDVVASALQPGDVIFIDMEQ